MMMYDEEKSGSGSLVSISAASECRPRSDSLLTRTMKRVQNAMQKSSTNSLHDSLLQEEMKDEVCKLEDSPVYALKAAGQGLFDVVEKFLKEDNNTITKKDNKGWTCLHHATARGRLKIIDLLLTYGADIEAKDAEGHTPLNIAILKGKVEALEHLLLRGANSDTLNNASMTPLQCAVFYNKPDIIEAFAKHPEVDFNMRGLNGSTALHAAAGLNCAECAIRLLKFGCKLCMPCDNGFYPIHVAAKKGANEVLEVLMNEGLKLGYTKAHMLSFVDKERNSPLHSAVNSADYNAVKLCLDFGAEISARQDDQATAFHLACTQGTLCIVKLMFEAHKEKYPESYQEILFAKDVLNMTPLHRAAMFDHPLVVEYLIDKGSDINELDSEHRTPLLLAAVRGGGRSLRVLLEAKANTSIVDSKKRNILHFLVCYGTKVTDELSLICKTEEGKKLLNQRDNGGCTPLHLSSKHGNLKFLEFLISLGAIVNLKNNQDQSPLHFAARYGRLNTVRKLLDSPFGSTILNETDSVGMTALHIASMNGHQRVVNVLLQKGALLHKDFMGRTPLHLASENVFTQTMKLLLAFHMNLLNQKDKQQNQAIHYAAAANASKAVDLLLSANCDYEENDNDRYPLDICIESHHVETALVFVQHDRWDEFLYRCSKMAYKCPLNGLIQYLPEVHAAVLDRCHTTSDLDPSDKCYWEKFNFRYMQVANKKLRKQAEKQMGIEITPLLALNMMVRYGRVELLAHPVSLQYLRMKWKAYGFLLYALNLGIYLMFVGCLTGVIASLDHHTNNTIDLKQNVTNATQPATISVSTACQLALTFVFVFLMLNIVKEILQIYQQRLLYFRDWVNYIEWGLYVSSLFFVTATLFNGEMSPYQWKFATVAAFLAWFNLLLYLQRLDSVGIFVVMFIQIMSTVWKVIVVFSVLFIAFGLAFYILFARVSNGGFSEPGISILHAVMWMMGDWNFIDIFVEPLTETGSLEYAWLSVLFLLIFVVLMPILFINLLIGLAVGDIEMVQKNAQLKRLAMQVEYHTELEDKLPYWFIDRVDKDSITEYPNSACNLGFIGNMVAVAKSVGTALGGSVLSNSSSSSATSARNKREAILFDEVEKCKKRMKIMQSKMDQQHDLLKLIVQKMEIVSEADNFDEGASPDDDSLTEAQCAGTMSTGPSTRDVALTSSLKSQGNGSKQSFRRVTEKMGPVLAMKKLARDH